ncbi:MAG: TetR/AcrR family transcriptional regulator [Anaerolineales bacterium]|jgi:AcrR family transcriptional regulator
MTNSPPPPSPEETRQRIIDAAVELGSQVGYAKATTKAIAEAAGVNEVTLFRHFGTKENLFLAAVEQYGGPAIAPAIEAQFTDDYHKDMIMLGNLLMKVFLERGEMMRLLLCESAHFPEVKTVMARNPRELRKMLARYLQSQMDKGIVKEQHPEALAQAFMGMFLSYFISLHMLDEDIQPKIEQSELVTTFVDIFVAGTIK